MWRAAESSSKRTRWTSRISTSSNVGQTPASAPDPQVRLAGVWPYLDQRTEVPVEQAFPPAGPPHSFSEHSARQRGEIGEGYFIQRAANAARIPVEKTLRLRRVIRIADAHAVNHDRGVDRARCDFHKVEFIAM